MLVIILYMSFNGKKYLNLDMNEINEKNVNFFYVFFSNYMLILKNIFLGFISFGFFCIFSLLQNVISLGIISNSLIMNGHLNLFFKMIPHGLFEIFGIVLSVTTVIYILYTLIKLIPQIIKKECDIKRVIINLIRFIATILFFELILFTLAGILETIISFVKVM